MSIFLLLIPFVGTFLGFWIIWRLVSINLPDPPEPRDVGGLWLAEDAVLDKNGNITSWPARVGGPKLTSQARARGVVLPKDFVGPTFNSTRTERDAAVARTYNPRPGRANFWTEDEP